MFTSAFTVAVLFCFWDGTFRSLGWPWTPGPTVLRTVLLFLLLLFLHWLLFIYFYIVWVLSSSMSVDYMHVVSSEDRKGHQSSWDWNYRQLWDTMGMLRIKPGSSRKIISVLNSWGISLALCSDLSWKVGHVEWSKLYLFVVLSVLTYVLNMEYFTFTQFDKHLKSLRKILLWASKMTQL